MLTKLKKIYIAMKWRNEKYCPVYVIKKYSILLRSTKYLTEI